MKSIARQQGEQAIARGGFGSPWIFVDGEPFLGQRSAVDGRAVARGPMVGAASDCQQPRTPPDRAAPLLVTESPGFPAVPKISRSGLDLPAEQWHRLQPVIVDLRRNLRRHAALAPVQLRDPAAGPPARQGVAPARDRGGERARGRIGELGWEDHGREERGGGEVGDAEAVADQVAGRPELGLETVERRERLLAAARRAGGVDLHVGVHRDPEGREEGAVEALGARPAAEREGGGRELGLWQELIEQRAPHVRAELLVEELLERERPAALRRVGRVERRLRPQALEALDDARRVVDRLAVEHQDEQRLLPRHPEHARDVEAGQERAAHVSDALPVERPARLLVEVREAKLPEDGRRHRYTLSARWSAQPLGTPAGVTVRPSGAPRLGLVGEQLEGVAPVRAGETLGRVAVRIIEYVGE